MPKFDGDELLVKSTDYLVQVLEELYALQDIFSASIREDTLRAALGDDGYQRLMDAELELSQTESGLEANLKAVSDVVRQRVLASKESVDSVSFSVALVQPKPKYDTKMLDRLAAKSAEVAACRVPEEPYTRITRKKVKS